MPALIVRTLAEWLVGNGGTLVAGAAPPALDRAVEGVARPRRFTQNQLAAIDVHEVVLALADAFPPDAEFPLDALLTELAPSQAALIVAGLPTREAAPDQRPYATADRVALPLFAIPFTTNLTDLAHDITGLLRAQQTQMEGLVRVARLALAHARHSDASLAQLAQALAQATGFSVAVEDEHRVLMTLATQEDDPAARAVAQAALGSFAARRAVRPATPDGLGEDIPVQRHLPEGLARAIVPILDGVNPIAYLSLFGPDARISHHAVELLWRIAPILADDVLQARAALPPAHRSAADDLASLLEGDDPTRDPARLALEHHLDLGQPWAVVLAQASAAEEQTAQWAREQADHLNRQTLGYWAAAQGPAVVVLLSAAGTSDEALQTLLKMLAGETATTLMLGVGRPAPGIAGARRSLREAQEALRGTRLQPDRPIMRYTDLGVLRLLLPLEDAPALREFCQETLAPLIHADHHQSDGLLTTLDHWLAANGNLTEAARRLNLHRNTLMYRLHRIEELLGASLDDADRRLALHLALKIWHAFGPT